MSDTRIPPIEKVSDGFRQDFGSHELVWDRCGHYRGQYQDDMISDGVGDFGHIFIGPDPTGRCHVEDLSSEQMRRADSASKATGGA